MDYLTLMLSTFAVASVLVATPHIYNCVAARKDWQALKSAHKTGGEREDTLYSIAWAVAARAKNNLMKMLYLVLGILSGINTVYFLSSDTEGGVELWWWSVAFGLLITAITLYNSYGSWQKEKVEKIQIERGGKSIGINGKVTLKKLAALL